MTQRVQPDAFPSWYDGQSIHETAFCRAFLTSHQLLYTENCFFTPEGRMTDEAPLKAEIYRQIEPYASTGVPKKIANIIELLKITAHIDDFPPADRAGSSGKRDAVSGWDTSAPPRKKSSAAAFLCPIGLLRRARKRGCTS